MIKKSADNEVFEWLNPGKVWNVFRSTFHDAWYWEKHEIPTLIESFLAEFISSYTLAFTVTKYNDIDSSKHLNQNNWVERLAEFPETTTIANYTSFSVT